MQKKTHTNKYPVGRFAPSPTGPLHSGSVIAALASYLHNRKQHGKWLLRIDDIDLPRNQTGAAEHILGTLEALGMVWDDEVIYQSRRMSIYREILADLESRKLVYPCSCTRSETKGRAYPGSCRTGIKRNRKSCALRIRTDDRIIRFTDRIQGDVSQCLEEVSGDFIIKRSDGHIAYHLATVIDDHLQGVTEIVRGTDLLDSTPRQIYLQQLLGYSRPDYVHHPVALNQVGQKISKQNHAPAIDSKDGPKIIFQALMFLGQSPDPALRNGSCQEILNWGREHWNIDAVPENDRILLQTY